jgi:hypothetical protein
MTIGTRESLTTGILAASSNPPEEVKLKPLVRVAVECNDLAEDDDDAFRTVGVCSDERTVFRH